MRAKIGEYFLVLIICIASLEASLFLIIKFGFLDVSFPSYSIASAKPFWRNLNGFTLAMPREVEHWSPRTPREKLVKIGAKVVSHGRYVSFHLAEVAVPRELFRKFLSLIDDPRPRPAPA